MSSIIATTLHTFLETLPHDADIMVAYSGGVDSHVLLHALAALQKNTTKKYQLRAIYINHHLSPRAMDWQHHTQSVCEDLKIPYQTHSITIEKKPRESLEAAARDARYAVLAKALPASGFLVTAHHQNDQLETVLLQLSRGSSPKGLAAMAAIKPFALGFHARPFLNITRQDCLDYAKQHGLSWVEDPSNQHLNFDRNFLRHQTIPALESRWPMIAAMATRTAAYCAQMSDLLEDYLDETLATIQGSQINTLSRQKLLQYSPIKQRHLLRRFFAQQNLVMPTRVQLAQIQNMLGLRIDAQPAVTWENAAARCYRDDLYAAPADQFAPAPDALRISWDMQSPIELPHGLGKLWIEEKMGHGLSLSASTQACELRFAAPGSTRIHLAGRQHSSVLNKLWQDNGIPPWERRRIPLLYLADRLALIPGIGVAAEFAANAQEMGKAVWWIK